MLAVLAGGLDREAARAWTLLAFIVGKGAGRDTARSRLLLRHAEAAGERFGGDPELTACRLTYEGELAFVDGRFEETLNRYQKALELRRQFLPSQHPDIGTSLTDMAGILGQLGRYEEAVELSRSALTNLEAALGPHHPNVAYALQSLGSAEAELGRSEDALAFHQRALEIFESAYGAESHTPQLLGDLERAMGPEHSDVGRVLTGQGRALLAMKEPRAALGPLERAVALWERVKGNPGRVEAAHARFALARALTASGGDTRRAILLAWQAREVFAAQAPAERHPLEEITGWLRQHGDPTP